MGTSGVIDLGTVLSSVPSAYQTYEQTKNTLSGDGYATKVISSTAGHFAGLDANGGLTDSGKSASDFMAADAKVQRIYNSAGTDALDDKGRLFDSAMAVGGIWDVSVIDHFNNTRWTARLEYAGWKSDWAAYEWNAGGFDVIRYYKSNGNVVWSGQFTLSPKAPTGKDPSVQADSDALAGTYSGTDYRYEVTAVYTPQSLQPNTTPYGHFALESVPTRAIAANTPYAVGDLLGDSGKAYRCTTAYTSAATPVAPSSDTSHWVEMPVLAQKQDTLTFDAAPTAGSSNPVTSGGVKTAIDNIKPMRIYNETGTDALNDKGQLFKSVTSGNYFVQTNRGSYYYSSTKGSGDSLHYYYVGVNAWYGSISYYPYDGRVELGETAGKLFGCEPHKNPTVEGTTLTPDNPSEWSFVPFDTRVETTPYGHLAVESLPDRTWAAGLWVPGDLVKYGDKAYRCKAAANASHTTVPSSDTTHWTEIPILEQKQDALGFTPEDSANKVTSLSAQSTDTQYPSAKCVFDAMSGIKPTRLYNTAGTDALDDKGQLYKSSLAGNYWTKNGVRYYYIGKETWSWPATAYLYSANPAGVNYDIAYLEEYGWLRASGGSNSATGLPTGKKLDLGDNIEGSYEGWSFTPLTSTIETSPYAHFALEALPDRTWAAGAWAVGDLVSYSGKAYRCKAAATSSDTTAPSSDTTRWEEIPTLANAGGGTPLAGNTYDFSLNADIVKAVADMARALGATVNNDPTEESES